jgi:hypothetical protein
MTSGRALAAKAIGSVSKSSRPEWQCQAQLVGIGPVLD